MDQKGRRLTSSYRSPRTQVKGYKTRPILLDIVRDSKQAFAKKTRKVTNTGTTIQLAPSYKLGQGYTNTYSRKKSRYAKLKKSKKQIVFLVTSTIVCLTVVINIVYFTAQVSVVAKPTEQIKATSTSQENSTNDLSLIDETQPKQEKISNYRVASDLPRYLYIDSIGVSARVIRVGVDGNNDILTPKNNYDVAWYEGSSKPDEPGAVFINGHVSGPTKKGIFYNLKKLNKGDLVFLEKGNFEKITYKVVNKEEASINNVDMNKVLQPYDNKKQGLNLMTCTGEYDKNAKTFKNRLIIYAVRI